MVPTSNISNIQKIQKLSVLISQDGLLFSIEGTGIKQEQVTFKESLNPIEILKEIQLAFEKKPVLQLPVDNLEIIYDHNIFALVPTSFFKEEQAVDYLKYNTRILQTDIVAHDTIENQGITVVFVPYTNINNYFYEQFGSFDYFHIATQRIENSFDAFAIAKSKDTQLHLYLSSTHFDITIHTENGFQFYNHFIQQAPEDIAYYTLFTIEQLDIDVEKASIKIHNRNSEKIDTTLRLLRQYMRHVEVIETQNTLSIV